VTLFERWENLRSKKVLFVGDIKHSRVVGSHLQLSSLLNYKIGYCAPKALLPEDIDTKNVEVFYHLDEGLKWADAVVGLRVQKERHSSQSDDTFISEYRESFGLNSKRLEKFKSNGFILHPGPINYGVELEKEVLSDSRSVILQLVENGAFMRETLIRQILQKQLFSTKGAL
jgi:aspartate carbamoyltransferase catalytic subunit